MLREDATVREFDEPEIILREHYDAEPPPIVSFDPAEVARRQLVAWDGLQADKVQLAHGDAFEYSFQSSRHLLAAAERIDRSAGESSIEGLPSSALRHINQKLSLVPAGHRFNGWLKPRGFSRVNYFYIDPRAPLLADVELKPMLHFFDRDLWDTTMKLSALVENPSPESRRYAEALSVVLLHELVRVSNGGAAAEPIIHGGLAAWQQKRIADYIEEHLADDVSLATLAGLANLSPYHFSRAFRQSFGIPPHRYHISRRIERAKGLIANASLSMTEIGMRLGFSESSAFTATFRRFTGRTPSDFRRSLQ